MPDAAATASPISRRGNGKSTLAQMPSERRSRAGRCVSQRSIPRVGTATTSRANGSAGGVGEQVAQRLDEAVGPVGSVDVEHRYEGVARGPANLTQRAYMMIPTPVRQTSAPRMSARSG